MGANLERSDDDWSRLFERMRKAGIDAVLREVILASALQPKYDVVQDREYPEHDYCYCDVCRSMFRDQHGIDPLELEDPSLNAEWRQFRCDRITQIVKEVARPIARADAGGYRPGNARLAGGRSRRGVALCRRLHAC